MNILTVAQNPAEIDAFSSSSLSTIMSFSGPSSAPAADFLVDQVNRQRPPPDHTRRNGKIARLPKETRQIINRMLDDGLPYRVIIDELGNAGAGLNAQNLTNWVQGGYQDYLKHQDLLVRARAQLEFATDLLRETGDPDPALLSRALNLIAGTQMMTAIMHHGKEALSSMLQTDPATFLDLLNTLCRMTDTALELEKYHDFQNAISACTAVSPPHLSSPIKPIQAPQEKTSPDTPIPPGSSGDRTPLPVTRDLPTPQPPSNTPVFKPNQVDSSPTK